jgi:hypothetical protein
LDPGREEAGEERPKSPWTPSYSVTTQGSATHETAELDELDQLPPRAIETIEQPTNSDIEAAPVENSELVAVDALVDADHAGGEMSQNHPADVAVINIAADEPLPDVPLVYAAAVVPQEDGIPVLTVSSSSVDDIAPQASRERCHAYYFLTLSLSVVDSGHFAPGAGWRRRPQAKIAMDPFIFCYKSRQRTRASGSRRC